MKKRRINFVGEEELKNINTLIEKAKFNKKSLRREFNDISISDLCSKKSNVYLTDVEVPARVAEKALTVRTLYIIPVARQYVQ